MLNTLLKKQILEMNQSVFINKKTGKKRTYIALVAVIFIFAIFMIFIVGGLFTLMSLLLSPLITKGMAWMYFLIMAATAIIIGIFGTIFNAGPSLYQSKDNDLLLSLPIPVGYIIFARLAGVYMAGLMHSMVVFIPATIIYLIKTDVTFTAVAGPVIFALLVSIFVFILACILGWTAAKSSSRMKNKSLMTVVLTLLLMGIYYMLYFKANEIIKSLISNADAISSTIILRVRVLYFIGDAAAGNIKSLAVVTLITAAILALVLCVISKTFISVATSTDSSARRVYKEKSIKAKNIKITLLKKEIYRFTSSSTYMLNCSMGSVFMLIASAVCVVKGEYVINTLSQIGIKNDFLPAAAVIGICMMMSANSITAPSISMESSNMWLLKSLPVAAKDILCAKLRLHLIFTDIPALICAICACILIKPDAVTMLMMAAIIIAYGTMSAAFGLIMNLKNPNFSWTSETTAIKQNISIIIVIFGGWAVTALLAAMYFLISSIISADVYLAVCLVIFVSAALLLYHRVMTEGASILNDRI